MGKISSPLPPPNQSLPTHFSHPHPLRLCSSPPPQTHNNPSSLCSGCRKNLSGPVYSCTLCNYFLHKKCFEMPNKITHPCHKDHTFTLFPHPPYADGIFKCDACGEKGEGFSYHCKPCKIDLHITCAVLPLKVSHPAHAHKLYLTFGAPYYNKEFYCDLCRNRGSDHWLYRCVSCGFDAHLKCATTAPIQREESHHQRQIPEPATTFPTAPIGVPAGNPVVPSLLDIQRQQNEIIFQAMRQSRETGIAMVQAILSGNGYGQLSSNLYGNGGSFGYGGTPGLGAYGGGAVGQEYLQALMNAGGYTGLNPLGGGAGAQDYYLQAMMNGGGVDAFGSGVPGLDALGGGGAMGTLQSLLGGGGLDFLGGAFGGFGF